MKLCKLTGKKLRTLQECLTNLQNGGYIVVIYNVKESEIYPKNLPRVIWLEEMHASHKAKSRNEKRKTRENDYRTFVKWLKLDCKGIRFPVDIGGLVHAYYISADGLLYRQETGETPTLLASDDSQEIFKRMWRKKSLIIKALENEGVSSAVQKLATMKRIEDEA